MSYEWLGKPKATLSAPFLAVLALAAVACGAAAPATPAPTAPPAEPPPAAMAEPAPEPTAVPAPMQEPPDDMVAGPKQAPVFDEYWTPDTDFYGEPVYGGTLRINYEDPLEHANTWGASTGAATRYRGATMNRIVSDNPYDNTEIIPDLAKGWTLDEGVTGATFYFHDNITWHNGEPFVCEDARFTFETWVTGNGITASSNKANFSFIDMDNTSCIDDLTLHIGYFGPTAPGLLALTRSNALMFNKKWFLEGGEEAMFQDVSVGTGPYIWREGQTVGIDEQHFDKNPNYFKGGGGVLPYVDELVVFGILDETTQQATMMAHQTDWHWVRNFGQYREYVEHDQIMTVIRATRGHFQIWLDSRSEPWDNVRVRQAVFMGIDRQAGIQVLQDGFGSEGFLMVPGSAWELSQEEGCAVPGWCTPADMEAQREEAIQILNEEGFDFDKTYLFTVQADSQVVARSTFAQEQLRLLGIKTDFNQVEIVAIGQMRTQGTWIDIMPGNATMPTDDPALGMGYYFRCDSTANYWTPGTECDEEMETLLDQALSEGDPVARKEISDQIQLKAMREYWKFPLYWEQGAVAFWPEVRGYFHHPQPSGAHTQYEQMWINPAYKDDRGNSGQTTGVPGGV